MEGKIKLSTFGCIICSLWWSIVTMITVSYGYVIPITPIEKIIFIIIILIGLGFVALPAAMLVEIFEEELRTIR
ncbi:MAG TPA: hypothetical protein DIS98_03695 [Colwellia sp.]|nr:hypothetical protein [Colwellia sp.]